MGKVFEGILMVAVVYAAYKFGHSDGLKEADAIWNAGVRATTQTMNVMNDKKKEDK